MKHKSVATPQHFRTHTQQLMPVLKDTHTPRHNALCPPSILIPHVAVSLFSHWAISVETWHVLSPWLVSLQLSVAALWQTSAASSSAQASQGITRAAWTAAGEFSSRLALVRHHPLSFLSCSPLLSLFSVLLVTLMSSLLLSSASSSPLLPCPLMLGYVMNILRTC